MSTRHALRAVLGSGLLAAGLSAAPAVEAQGAGARARVAAAELLPLAVGDRWLFGDAEGEPTSSLMVTEPLGLRQIGVGGIGLESDDGELALLSFDGERGLLLIEASGLEPEQLTFEPPLALLPPTLEPGAVHVAESAVVEWRDRSETRRGTRRVEARINPPAPIRAPAGQWLAWPVRTETTTTWSGEDPVVTVEETWYAPGVGPVQRRRETAAGRRLETLLEAMVGGRPIPP